MDRRHCQQQDSASRKFGLGPRRIGGGRNASDQADLGGVPVDSTKYAAGATVTVLGNTGTLSWPGFTFTGWNTLDNGGLDGGGGGTFYSPGTTFVINSTMTLYGTWVSGP